MKRKENMHLLQYRTSPKYFNATPSSGEAYRDRQLTTNFEF